jgi:hypothetical protein
MNLTTRVRTYRSVELLFEDNSDCFYVCVAVRAVTDDVWAVAFDWEDINHPESFDTVVNRYMDELDQFYPEGSAMRIKDALNDHYRKQ